MSEGTLYIVSAPSGAGKTSLLAAVHEELFDLTVIISHTTRAPRPGEQHGVHYHFVTHEEFEEMKDAGEFLEYAQVFGNYYGTSKQLMNEQLARGDQIVLEIDWQGAQQIREIYPQAISIFILPPTVAELERRLRARDEDDEQTIQQRMAEVQSEISHYPEYQYLIINDNWEEATQALEKVLSQPIEYTPPSDVQLEKLLADI